MLAGKTPHRQLTVPCCRGRSGAGYWDVTNPTSHHVWACSFIPFISSLFPSAWCVLCHVRLCPGSPTERHRLQPAHLWRDSVQWSWCLRAAPWRWCRRGVWLSSRLPGRILPGHGEWGIKSATDTERGGRNHRPAGHGIYLRQTEAEAKTEAQVNYFFCRTVDPSCWVCFLQQRRWRVCDVTLKTYFNSNVCEADGCRWICYQFDFTPINILNQWARRWCFRGEIAVSPPGGWQWYGP